MTLRRTIKSAGKRFLDVASKLSNQTLFRFNYQLLPAPNVTVLRPWEYDAEFLKLLEEIRSATLVDPIRCFMLYQAARSVRTVPGDVAELGVYKGGTGRMLSRVLAHKPVHLFDTFEGMPERDGRYDSPTYTTDFLSDTSLEQVTQFLADRPNVKLYAGTFPGTSGPIEQSRFAFVHLDADVYPATLSGCEFFYPRMNPGGVLMFDDFGNCPGVVKAAEEFFADKPEVVSYLQSGQGIVTKLH